MFNSLEQKATELVGHLSREDVSGIFIQYETELLKLGKHSIKPLKEFLAKQGGLVHYPLANYDYAKRILNNIILEGKMKNEIALVIVDAVASGVEHGEGASIVKENIQNLVNQVNGDSYEFFTDFANIKGTTYTEKIDKKIELKKDYNEIILVGGSLGGQHYSSLLSILNKSGTYGNNFKVSIPLDCTYVTVFDRFDGESFTRTELALPDMPIFEKYNESVKGLSINELKLWSESRSLIDYLDLN
jgi:hypothetical protein